MRFRTAAVAAFASLLVTTAASAQTIPSQIKPFPVSPSSTNSKNVNISVSYQFFLEGNASDMDEQAKLADEGRKHLYRMLARECEVLLDTIADTCAINRANVSSRVQNLRNRQDGIQISGSATYLIELKPTGKADRAD
jgi:hypothetical protein